MAARVVLKKKMQLEASKSLNLLRRLFEIVSLVSLKSELKYVIIFSNSHLVSSQQSSKFSLTQKNMFRLFSV